MTALLIALAVFFGTSALCISQVPLISQRWNSYIKPWIWVLCLAILGVFYAVNLYFLFERL